jgi:hypothetical protein
MPGWAWAEEGVPEALEAFGAILASASAVLPDRTAMF